ncbi:MAG TPA: LOG family protein, partial [Polyangia bacterium]
FHYFFMRKLWFSHLARALVVFPGGFGTLDEMAEILTLQQTGKLDRRIVILLYGSDYWQEIINFDALVRHGMIAAEDLQLFKFVDAPAAALGLLKAACGPSPAEAAPEAPAPAPTPAFAPSRVPPDGDGDDG